MVRESLFKSYFCRTYIFLRRGVVAVSMHGRFINNTASQAFPGERAMIWVSAVAAPKFVVMPVLCPTHAGIMALDKLAPIWHTAVA